MDFLIFIGALLVVLTVHEASHALVAYYLGDSTAKVQGRLSLNPVRHLDLLGSLLFLITMRIGWGKPVPIDPRNFKNPVRGSAFTALAGPVSNFIFAFVLALFLKYVGPHLEFHVSKFFWTMFDLNIFLGVFNLFPFPPLDGSKILGLFVPRKLMPLYERFLENGFKYFVGIILFDVLILNDLLGFSIFGFCVRFLFQQVRLVILLGT